MEELTKAEIFDSARSGSRDGCESHHQQEMDSAASSLAIPSRGGQHRISPHLSKRALAARRNPAPQTED